MAEPAGPERVPDAVRVQILATEHWSLLATRQLAWTEAFTRTTIFLTVLSAAVVGLALVAQTGSDRDFRLFALVLLPVVLFLGIATFFRLAEINQQDGWLLVGMNRLRRGYLDIAPDLAPYFVTGATDDRAGLARTVGLGGTSRGPMALQVLISTPVVVGVLDAVVAGVLAGIATRAAGGSPGLATGLALVAALLVAAALAVYPARQITGFFRAFTPRFEED